MLQRSGFVLLLASLAGAAGLAACHGLTNTPDPNIVHVANLAYGDTACEATTCGGKVRFQLLNSAGAARMGVVLIFVYEPTPIGQGVTTGGDGWGWVPVSVPRAGRPYRIVACPEGVEEGNSRCAIGTTG